MKEGGSQPSRVLIEEAERRDLLPLVGCLLLKNRPLFPDLEPDEDDNPGGEVQSDWIDDQLYRCRPFQANLGSLGDAQFSAMQAAWPDGFHWVVFGDGERDEEHAAELIEPYLEWAESFDHPLMTDFESTQEEMEGYLTEEFVRMIRAWREVVLRRLWQGDDR